MHAKNQKVNDMFLSIIRNRLIFYSKQISLLLLLFLLLRLRLVVLALVVVVVVLLLLPRECPPLPRFTLQKKKNQ